MLERVRHSLAVRLGVLYALVFTLGAAVVFGVLYWFLAAALEKREQGVVERRAEALAVTYERGGGLALRASLENDASPDAGSFFVRLIGPDGTAMFVKVPPNWIETQIQHLPVPEGFGLTATREIRTVRIPQNALRDYAVASRPLSWRLAAPSRWPHRQPGRAARAVAPRLSLGRRRGANARGARRHRARVARHPAVAPSHRYGAAHCRHRRPASPRTRTRRGR
jgi:hypothetical protein